MNVLNFYGGPGTGKSTHAAAVFAELKFRGINCEYVQEYAKDRVWELGEKHEVTPKVFQAQEYIFGKQHFRLRRVATEVDVVVTDSPILLGLIYMPEDFTMPSLRETIREAYGSYNNLDVFLRRNKPYNPKGRMQTEEKAREIDSTILGMLHEEAADYVTCNAGREAIPLIVDRAMAHFGLAYKP